LDALRATLVTDHASLSEALTAVAALGCSALDGCSSASITVMQGTKPTTIAFTDGVALPLDEAQYDARTGPCLRAIEEARIVRVDAFGPGGEWAQFEAEALEHGMHSSLSLPLRVGSEAVGALNCYSDHEAAFDEHDELLGGVFATHAMAVISNAVAYWRAVDETKNLTIALESRGVIERAKGILMAGSKLTADEAFDLLRRASQRENRKLHAIAEDIVNRRDEDNA
jgi:GAF domain-containing protein